MDCRWWLFLLLWFKLSVTFCTPSFVPLTHVDQLNQAQRNLRNKSALLFFTSDSKCDLCRDMEYEIEAMFKRIKSNNLIVYKINLQNNSEIFNKLHVHFVPSLYLVARNKRIGERVNLIAPKDDLNGIGSVLLQRLINHNIGIQIQSEKSIQFSTIHIIIAEFALIATLFAFVPEARQFLNTKNFSKIIPGFIAFILCGGFRTLTSDLAALLLQQLDSGSYNQALQATLGSIFVLTIYLSATYGFYAFNNRIDDSENNTNDCPTNNGDNDLWDYASGVIFICGAHFMMIKLLRSVSPNYPSLFIWL